MHPTILLVLGDEAHYISWSLIVIGKFTKTLLLLTISIRKCAACFVANMSDSSASSRQTPLPFPAPPNTKPRLISRNQNCSLHTSITQWTYAITHFPFSAAATICQSKVSTQYSAFHALDIRLIYYSTAYNFSELPPDFWILGFPHGSCQMLSILSYPFCFCFHQSRILPNKRIYSWRWRPISFCFVHATNSCELREWIFW